MWLGRQNIGGAGCRALEEPSMSSEVITPTSRRSDVLPAWTTVLAVVAHPDDESFGLGALLDAFTNAGASVEVLCLTHGEASTLHGTPGDLATLRGVEPVSYTHLTLPTI